jgi:hypothetical protein
MSHAVHEPRSRVTAVPPEPVWAFAYLAFNAAAWRGLGGLMAQEALRTALLAVVVSIALSMIVLATAHLRLPRVLAWLRRDLWRAGPFLVGVSLLSTAHSSGGYVLLLVAVLLWGGVSAFMWNHFVPSPKTQRA